MKLIRLDATHFVYLVPDAVGEITSEEAERIIAQWEGRWPEATLIVIQADEFVDATGTSIDLGSKTFGLDSRWSA